MTGLQGVIASKMFGKKKKTLVKKPATTPPTATPVAPATVAPAGIAVGNPFAFGKKKLAK